VRVEDVEAAASVHQHLGELGIPDDGVHHQRILEGPIRRTREGGVNGS
jgi:hypothetical protein